MQVVAPEAQDIAVWVFAWSSLDSKWQLDSRCLLSDGPYIRRISSDFE